MKRLFAFAAALLLTAAPSAFAEDDELITKDIKQDDFTSLVCSIPCAIEYSVGEPSFSITADKKVVEHIVNYVKEGKLSIVMDKKLFYKFADMTIKLSSPKLNSIELNGSIQFSSKGIETDTFEANLNGTSSLTVEKLEADRAAINNNGTASLEIKGIECDDITVNVNGVGGCELAGHAGKANLTVNGIGGIEIKDFTADNLNSEVNGIGKISKGKN